MEGNSWNPWTMKSLEDFLFYCCPECDHRTKNFEPFFNHAISTHEMATKLLEFVRKIQLPLIEVSNKSGAMPIYFAKKNPSAMPLFDPPRLLIFRPSIFSHQIICK